MKIQVRGMIRTQGKYADGMDSQFIAVKKQDAAGLPHVEDGTVEVNLVVGDDRYVGKIITTRPQTIVYVSSDVRTLSGKKERFAALLAGNGFRRNDEVLLEVDGNTVRVLPVSESGDVVPAKGRQSAARSRQPPGFKLSSKDSAPSSRTPVTTFDISTLKTPEDRPEFYARLWTTIRNHLNTGIPNWQEKIIGFGQVAAAENREKGKQRTDNEIFEGFVKAILSSNNDWAKIERVLPELQSLFHNFELTYYASLTDSDVLNKIHPWFKERSADSQNLKQDLVRLIQSSKQLLIYSKDHGGLDNFITALLKANGLDPKLLALELGSNTSKHKLRGMGIALAAEALRNIGFDIAKPDRHINRAMGCFGLVRFGRWSESYINLKGKKATRFIEVDEPPGGYSYPEATEENSIEVMKTMEDFAKSIKVRPVFLDNAIWLLCAKSGLYTSNEGLRRLALL